MITNVLLAIAICFVIALLLTRLMKLLNLPNVTGYIIAGLIVSPFTTKLISVDMMDSLTIISNVALGFIAFAAGNEFRLKLLKQIGGKILTITVVQAVAATAFVIGALFIVRAINPSLIGIPAILLLGAIAAATAPAITLLVIKQYKARGHLTDILMPVVAFDDLIGLFLFSICLGIAKVLLTDTQASATNMFLLPLLEIVKSLAVGAGIGFILVVVCKFFKSRANRLIWVIASVFAGVGLSQMWDMSPLITCMTTGMVFANLRKDYESVVERVDMWTPPLFMAFFILSGAHLDLRIIPQVGVVGIVYILARSLGKYFGSYFSAVAVKETKTVRNYLGFTLLPQAGVAIGMVTVIASTPGLEAIVPQITTVVLGATLFYELTGPIITKGALKRAGEITGEGTIPLVMLFRNLKARRKARVRFISGSDVDVPSEVLIESANTEPKVDVESSKPSTDVVESSKQEVATEVSANPSDTVVLDFIDDDIDYTNLIGRTSIEELEDYYTSSKSKGEDSSTVSSDESKGSDESK
ncbi:MAG TPA: cation:proton antiporter [Clostridia bacterium]|jgi:Kef-type K+ transport system membrane component KefB|nr:cation:proton antiporter [Clostridia bacterium]